MRRILMRRGESTATSSSEDEATRQQLELLRKHSSSDHNNFFSEDDDETDDENDIYFNSDNEDEEEDSNHNHDNNNNNNTNNSNNTMITAVELSSHITSATEESQPLLSTDRRNFPSIGNTRSNETRKRRSTGPIEHPRTKLTNNEPTLPLDAPIIDVIDRIEDEMETHAYEDLVPLEVKVALEDKVFGWTHLTSAILGHILFTFGSYYLVNELVTILWFAFSTSNQMPFYVSFIRISLSLWAAVNTYRTVRRRRHVWLRAAYGSKAYKQDEARRRQSVKETDRTTAIGLMMKRFQHRRTLKKLRKAEQRFAKKHNAMKKKAQELQTRELEEVTRPLILTRQCSESDSESSSSDSGNDESYKSTDTTVCSSSPETTTATLVPASRRHRRRPSFHTNPVNRMQSYAQDQVLFESIKVMPYAHGGFFGAAPFLLANPHWISILRHLMPDVYVEISRRVTKSKTSKLIHWAENNPVVAAYGVAHELEYNSEKPMPNLEWDVFLDPTLMGRVQRVLEARDSYLHSSALSGKRRSKAIIKYYNSELKKRSQALVDKMLIAHGNLTQLVLEQSGYAKRFNYSRVKRTRQTLGGGIYARQWMAVFAEALKLGVGGGPSHVEETESANVPLPPDTSQCPETTMADAARIVESIFKNNKDPNFGLVLDIKSRHVPKRIWSIVVDTLRTAGIRVEGIASFSHEDIRGVSRWCRRPVKEIIFFHSAGDLQKACHDGRIHRGDTVFLNGGSLLAETRSPDLLSRVLEFDPQEIKRSYRIQPFGLPTATPASITEKEDGNSDDDEDENETAAYKNAYPTIQLYKEYYDLSIGLYCQEFAVDEAAIDLIAKHVNRNPSLFDLGLSWGGVNGITLRGIAPGRFTSTDGYWNQRYVGQLWDYNLSLPPLLLLDSRGAQNEEQAKNASSAQARTLQGQRNTTDER